MCCINNTLYVTAHEIAGRTGGCSFDLLQQSHKMCQSLIKYLILIRQSLFLQQMKDLRSQMFQMQQPQNIMSHPISSFYDSEVLNEVSSIGLLIFNFIFMNIDHLISIHKQKIMLVMIILYFYVFVKLFCMRALLIAKSK